MAGTERPKWGGAGKGEREAAESGDSGAGHLLRAGNLRRIREWEPDSRCGDTGRATLAAKAQPKPVAGGLYVGVGTERFTREARRMGGKCWNGNPRLPGDCHQPSQCCQLPLDDAE